NGRPLSKTWEAIPAASAVESAPGAEGVADANGEGEALAPARLEAVHDTRISAAANPAAARPPALSAGATLRTARSPTPWRTGIRAPRAPARSSRTACRAAAPGSPGTPARPPRG